jgi:hypothetical protein
MLRGTMRLLIASLFVVCSTAMSQTNNLPKKSQAEIMREMRLKILTTPPAELGQKPSQDFPRVCGALMDRPIAAGIVTVVSSSAGDASIYTTGTFGVIGGIGHETVRNAAKRFVQVSDRHYDEAAPTKDYPYPKAGRVRFYLVCYDGVRVIDADLQSVASGKDNCSDLYIAGQRVLTELRLITQRQKEEQP